jgi:hypothetical protein
MPQSAQNLSVAYARKLTLLERTRQKIERLYANDDLAKRDAEQVYEALFISSITAFEALLEDLFFGLVMGRLNSTVPGVRCKVSIQSELVAREIALAGNAYLDWLPYSRTEQRAQLYLARGLPFSRLDDGNKSLLQQCLFVRNAIAHKSRHAIETYQEKVIGTMVLPPRERSPASFLRSQFRSAPNQCRYENYIAHLSQISHILCA